MAWCLQAVTLRTQEWSWIEEWWKLSLTGQDTHRHTHSPVFQYAHTCIAHVHTSTAYFTLLRNTLSQSQAGIYTHSVITMLMTFFHTQLHSNTAPQVQLSSAACMQKTERYFSWVSGHLFCFCWCISPECITKKNRVLQFRLYVDSNSGDRFSQAVFCFIAHPETEAYSTFALTDHSVSSKCLKKVKYKCLI